MNIDEALNAYLVCALWAESDDDGEPLDATYNPEDIDADSVAESRRELEDFISSNADDIAAYVAERDNAEFSGWEALGHDFWLTRNGHGVGFWDRGMGELGDRLSDNCKPYGEAYIYVGDDGKVYIQ